jgi:hypothetical protein
MESSDKNLNLEKEKEKGISTQGVSEPTKKPEHHLTSDVYIRERGHKSETVTHCPHKDSNLPKKDIHENKK